MNGVGRAAWARGILAAGLLLLSAWSAGLVSAASAAELPDGRGYELATPTRKGGVDAAYGGLPNFVSPDGSRLVWSSLSPLLNGNNGTVNQYEANRGVDAWTSEAMSLGQRVYHPINSNAAFVDFACDGCADLVGSSLESADGADNDPGFFGPGADVYRTGGIGKETWISRGTLGGDTFADASYGGRSDDGEFVAFTTSEVLEPDAAAVTPGASIAYARIGGETDIVGRNDDGTVMAGGSFIGGLNQTSAIQRGAVSADGSRVVFGSPDPNMGGSPHLYVREDGTSTIEISAPQCSGGGCGTGVVTGFQGASIDGSIVFFTSSEKLLDDDNNGTPDIYAYNGETSILTRVSAGDDGRATFPAVAFSRASDDGQYVYFWSRAVLTETPNLSGRLPVADGYNFYVHDMDSAETRLVATLVDNNIDERTALEQQGALAPGLSLSADGSVMVFQSRADLVESSNGEVQLYRYDATDESLECISCLADGSQTGRAVLKNSDQSASIWTPRRYVSADGSRIFFASSSALVPQDQNGVDDIYQWHDGAVSLLSSGTGLRESYFIDANLDGSDAFIATYDRLTFADDDESVDIYDVRVGGGFTPPPPPQSCTGEDCQGPLPAPQQDPVPGTSNFSGPGTTDDPAEPVRVNVFQVGGITSKQRTNLAKTGKVTLKVRVSEAGRVAARVAGRLGRSTRTVASRSATAEEGGTVELPLTLSGQARAQLRRTGKLQLTFSVTYSKLKGAQRTSLTLTRRAAAKPKPKSGKAKKSTGASR